jgi:hypothetical protein
MTLPEVCPLDESQTCKGRECHLFCLEWRTREPTCLIGYNTTSKVRSNKADRNKDTYAADTFRKLGSQPQPRWKNVSEKGDWTPTRMAERPPERSAERREDKFSHVADKDSNKLFFGCREETRCVKPEKSPEEIQAERLQKQAAGEAEKASRRLEARLKKEPLDESPIIYADPKQKAQEKQTAQEKPGIPEKTRVQEKPRVQEKIISRDKHATIFAPCDGEEKKDIYPSGREEESRKMAESRDKRKKFDEVMDIDLPDNSKEEFWS